MPQMSPLMWGMLFLIFSLLLLYSMIKMYFAQPTHSPSYAEEGTSTPAPMPNWTW